MARASLGGEERFSWILFGWSRVDTGIIGNGFGVPRERCGGRRIDGAGMVPVVPVFLGFRISKRDDDVEQVRKMVVKRPEVCPAPKTSW
jgi:hypothetical protein